MAPQRFKIGWIPRVSLAAVVALVLPLVAGVSLAAPVSVTPHATPTADGNQWAYGGQRWLNASGTSSNGQWTIQAFLGWHVILNQTNVSTSVFHVTVQRTMGAALVATYCQPTCIHPLVYANYSERAWESAIGSAYFTRNGTVLANNSSVPAIAILNSTSSVQANLTQSYSINAQGLFSSRTSSGALYVKVQAADEIDFSPALGVVPLSPTPGETWVSSATFNASGRWLADVFAYRTFANGTTSHFGEMLSGAPAGSGPVTLFGTAETPITLDNNVTVLPIRILVLGPFQVREGLIFVPAGADLFAGPTAPGANSMSGQPVASTHAVDLESGARAHFGLLASATAFAGTSSPPGGVAAVTPLALSPQYAPADGVNGTIQGQPEQVASAQSQSQCLSNSQCPLVGPQTVSPQHPLPYGLTSWLVVALVVVSVVALIALVTSRRRAVPPPPSPGASLYPPGAQAAPPPSVPPTAPGKNVPPPPPDPLDHLW